MPPKVKIDKESILEAAVDILREQGENSLHAREIAKRLGCSIQPIFSNYENMADLKEKVKKRGEEIYNGYMQQGMETHRIPFLGMGMGYILFAKEEKNLFRLLFMSNELQGNELRGLVQGEDNQQILSLISGMTGLSLDSSENLFLSIWLITHGMAAMVATNDLELGEEEVEMILMNAFTGIRDQLGKGDKRDE